MTVGAGITTVVALGADVLVGSMVIGALAGLVAVGAGVTTVVAVGATVSAGAWPTQPTKATPSTHANPKHLLNRLDNTRSVLNSNLLPSLQ